jgi:phospholipid/cholesterol/gamma-HCH transport system ATP-binding protein
MKLHAVGLRGARDLMPSQISAAWRGAWRWRAPLRWTRAGHVRRALCRAGPDLAGHGGAADPPAQRRHGLTSILVSHDLEETFRWPTMW